MSAKPGQVHFSKAARAFVSVAGEFVWDTETLGILSIGKVPSRHGYDAGEEIVPVRS